MRNVQVSEERGEQIHIRAGLLHFDSTVAKYDLTISSGSDVPIHLYSFSFNLNPDWSQELADQEEILHCNETRLLSPDTCT